MHLPLCWSVFWCSKSSWMVGGSSETCMQGAAAQPVLYGMHGKHFSPIPGALPPARHQRISPSPQQQQRLHPAHHPAHHPAPLKRSLDPCKPPTANHNQPTTPAPGRAHWDLPVTRSSIRLPSRIVYTQQTRRVVQQVQVIDPVYPVYENHPSPPHLCIAKAPPTQGQHRLGRPPT